MKNLKVRMLALQGAAVSSVVAPVVSLASTTEPIPFVDNVVNSLTSAQGQNLFLIFLGLAIAGSVIGAFQGFTRS